MKASDVDEIIRARRSGCKLVLTSRGPRGVGHNGRLYQIRARPLPKCPTSRRTTGGRLRPMKRAPTLRPGRMG